MDCNNHKTLGSHTFHHQSAAILYTHNTYIATVYIWLFWWDYHKAYMAYLPLFAPTKNQENGILGMMNAIDLKGFARLAR